MIPSRRPYSLNKKYLIYRSGKVFSRYRRKYVRSLNKMGDPIVDIKASKNHPGGVQLIRYLVAHTFLPNPDNFADVICLNHDRADCRARNLKWVSPQVAAAHWR